MITALVQFKLTVGVAVDGARHGRHDAPRESRRRGERTGGKGEAGQRRSISACFHDCRLQKKGERPNPPGRPPHAFNGAARYSADRRTLSDALFTRASQSRAAGVLQCVKTGKMPSLIARSAHPFHPSG